MAGHTQRDTRMPRRERAEEPGNNGAGRHSDDNGDKEADDRDQIADEIDTHEEDRHVTLTQTRPTRK